MSDLFRHLRAHVPPDAEATDLGNLGEVIAWPPRGIPSLAGDPCDEAIPTKAKEPDHG